MFSFESEMCLNRISPAFTKRDSTRIRFRSQYTATSYANFAHGRVHSRFIHAATTSGRFETIFRSFISRTTCPRTHGFLLTM